MACLRYRHDISKILTCSVQYNRDVVFSVVTNEHVMSFGFVLFNMAIKN